MRNTKVKESFIKDMTFIRAYMGHYLAEESRGLQLKPGETGMISVLKRWKIKL